MNNKGVTLVTVVVIIIVMIIIATVSIVAGNKLIISSNEYKLEQEVESVKAAVLRKKAEMGMAGSLIPTGESYVGVADPVLKSDGTETIVAEDWYYLDKEELEKLGIYDASNRFIINYDYEIVIALESEDYFEEYMISKCMINAIDKNSYVGIPLKNKTSTDTTGTMVKDNIEGTLYGSNWYLLKFKSATVSGDGIGEYAPHIKHDYLINYETAEYKQIDFNYSEI